MLYDFLGFVVDAGGGLVHDDDFAFAENGARDADQLLLADGQVVPVFADELVEAAGVVVDDVVEADFSEHGDDLLVAEAPDRVDVVAQRPVHHRRVLRDDRQAPAQLPEPDDPDVDAVDEDLPLQRLQNPEQHQSERALPAPRSPHYTYVLAARDHEVQVLEHDFRPRTVLRREVHELDAPRRRPLHQRVEVDFLRALARQVRVRQAALHLGHRVFEVRERRQKLDDVLLQHDRVRQQQPDDFRREFLFVRQREHHDERQEHERQEVQRQQVPLRDPVQVELDLEVPVGFRVEVVDVLVFEVVGANRRVPGKSFVDEVQNGAVEHSLDAREFSAAVHVEAPDFPADEQKDGQQNQAERLVQRADHDGPEEAGPEARQGHEPVHRVRVDGGEVLAEAVEDLALGDGVVEQVDGREDQAGDHFRVEAARALQRARRDEHCAEEVEERAREREHRVDKEEKQVRGKKRLLRVLVVRPVPQPNVRAHSQRLPRNQHQNQVRYEQESADVGKVGEVDLGADCALFFGLVFGDSFYLVVGGVDFVLVGVDIGFFCVIGVVFDFFFFFFVGKGSVELFVLDLFEGAFPFDLAVFDIYDLVGEFEVLQGVCDEDSGFVFEEVDDAVFHDALSDVCVEGADGVVEDEDVFVGVHGAGEADSRLLAAGEVDALLADFGHVAADEDVEVGLELAELDDPVVEGGLVGMVEENVVAHRCVLDPRLLRDVADLAVHDQPRVNRVADFHVVQNRLQQRRLARTHLADDAHEFTLPDFQVYVLQRQLVRRRRRANEGGI